jgi:hypothetical protein
VAKRWDPFQEQQQFKAEGWARNRVARKGGQESVLEKREERKGKRVR